MITESVNKNFMTKNTGVRDVPALRSGLLGVLAVIASVAIVGLATGFSVPLVSLRLAATGTDTTIIGVMAAMPALGILLIAPIVTRLTSRYSPRLLFLFSTILSALSILALGTTDSLPLWFVLRLTMGAASGVLVVLGEAWVNHAAEDGRRGRLVAVYATTFSLFQVAGPSLLAMTGSDGWQPLIIIAVLHVAAMALLTGGQCGFDISEEHAGLDIMSFIRQVPAIAFGVLTFSFFDSVVLAMMPLYGLHHGFSEELALLMVTVIFAGDASLQIPLGWLADKYDLGKLHLACGSTVVLLAGVIPFIMDSKGLLWPALVLLGAAAGGIYTLALIRIGHRFQGRDLVTANSAVAMLWGVGSLAGPVLGSAAFKVMEPDGLMVSLLLMALMFVITASIAKNGTVTG